MFKMGLHEPFRYLKHKLWQKKGLGVKLSIWFLATKSWKLAWFTCIHVAYRLKALKKGYNFVSNLTSIWGQHKKLWASKVKGDSISGIFQLGSPGTKWHLGARPMPSIENIIRGEVVASPSLGRDEFCEFVFVRDSSVHQNCSNYALTNLWFGLCRSMWIINLFITRLSPHPRAPTRPFTLEMLRVRECTPTFFPSVVFTFRLAVESIKEFGGAHMSGGHTSIFMSKKHID
jgi:hypothetical protein